MNNLQTRTDWGGWERLLDKPRVYVDLNSGGTIDGSRVALLGPVRTMADTQEQNISLAEGLTLDLWTDDGDDKGDPDPLLFRGIIRFDQDLRQWVVVINGDAFRHASEGNTQSKRETTMAEARQLTVPHGKAASSEAGTLL